MMRAIGRLGGACAVLAILLTGCDGGSSTLGPPTGATIDSGHAGQPLSHVSVGGQVDPAATYTLELLSGVTTLQVQSANLSGRLFRVSTPIGQTLRPSVRVSAAHVVQVSLVGSGSAPVTIELDSEAQWKLRFEAGIATAEIDMAGSSLHGLDALAGISTLDLTAGRPVGNVMVTETSGLSVLALHLPGRIPITVHANAGAGQIELYGAAHSGIAAGTTISTGSSTAADRYTIDADGGVSSIVVS